MSVALVTGAGNGIGAAVSAVLAARGFRVACLDRDGEAARATASGLPGALEVQADVTDAPGVEAAMDRVVARLGRPEVAVLCAGIESGARADELDVAAFRRTMEVNVTGSFTVAGAVARRAIAAGAPARIVLVASANGVRALPGQAAYAGSKGAVVMLTKSLAVDWAPFGIAVNAVAPGVTDTAMSAVSLGDPAKRAALLDGVPMGRPAQPVEIAAAAAFLAGPDASYITGVVLPVDGGWLARA
jgi:NAD(P)-dependent dehydrogenase (short-subunit alcohol dehydrogenase family)